MRTQHAPSYHRGTYVPAPALSIYNSFGHIQYNPQFSHPTSVPAPVPSAPSDQSRYGAQSSYSRFFPGDHRSILEQLDRDIEFEFFAHASTRQPPPSVPTSTSDAYSQVGAIPNGPIPPQTSFWSSGEGGPSPSSAPLRLPPSSHRMGTPGVLPGPSRSLPINQMHFDEEQARICADMVFTRFDHDRAGYLELQEFMDALRTLRLAISYHSAIDAFFRADVNRDGKISREEFLDIYITESRSVQGFQ